MNKFKIVTDSGINQDYKNYISDYILKGKEIEYVDINSFKFETMTEFENISMILITGGSDVNPNFYGEQIGKNTYIDPKRDKEYNKFSKLFGYINYTTPKLGICMGGQVLHVNNGGKLIQHVEGHNNGQHDISTYRGNSVVGNLRFTVPSDHHQMMYYDKNTKGELIAWSTRYMSNVYLNGKNEQMEVPHEFLEPEIIYYKDNNSLCIQSHPEYSSCNRYSKNYFAKIIKKYLNI